MSRETEFRATYRMLSHTRAQQLARAATSSTTNETSIAMSCCSPLIHEERRSAMTCCNIILSVDHRGSSPRHQHNETITSPKTNMTCHEDHQLESLVATRPPTRHRQRTHRPATSTYNLFSSPRLSTTKCLLATLVGLLCVVSLVADSLLLVDTQVNACPLSECMCKWSNGKKSAACDHRNLKSPPMQLTSDTQVLDLSGNQLTMLAPRIFQERRLTNLQRLFLSRCMLVHIADDAFAQLTNLVELDLSHNNLQEVPTRPLEQLKHSLRKLSLAHNQLHVIDSAAFSPLSHLQTLDLTRTMLSGLRVNAFAGLHELRELKMGDNELVQLPISSLSGLPENVMVDLYGNPWHCDCELRQTIEWMQRQQIQPTLNPTCASPPRHKDIRWQNVRPEEFMCPPVILNKHEEITVGAGSNLTLACSARGSHPLNFVWFQDEKNMTAAQPSPPALAGPADPAPSTRLLEERRYEIQEELTSPNITTSILYLINLKLTDTGTFLCWVQNDVGNSITNFTLIVDDSPPVNGYGTTSSGVYSGFGASLGRLFGLEPSGTASNSQIMLVVLAFLLLLAATIVTLFVLKQVSRGRSSKSSQSSDLKSSQAINSKLTSADKFSNGGKLSAAASGRMFATASDDGATDDDDDGHSSGDGASSSGSQSSCAKKGGNTRVLAVEELDGFIDHLRSGIINMDYHSMSPVIQFNNQKPHPSQVVDKKLQQQQQQQQQHQLQLSHFPSASNGSSQVYYGGVQASNGSNSMATTVSDLSPSSGSASTSFANTAMMPHHVMVAPQQQRQYMATLLRQQQQANCDYLATQQQHQDLAAPNATTTSYTSDYQSGYSEDPMMMAAQQQQQEHFHHHHQMMPPMYTDMDAAVVASATPPHGVNYAYQSGGGNLLASSRPSSMNGGVVYPDHMQEGRYPTPQQQQYQVQDPQQGPFTHIL